MIKNENLQFSEIGETFYSNQKHEKPIFEIKNKKTGVYYHKTSGFYIATIYVPQTESNKYIGSYLDKEKAEKALARALRMYSEFINT